jgi:hypothetical protein
MVLLSVVVTTLTLATLTVATDASDCNNHSPREHQEQEQACRASSDSNNSDDPSSSGEDNDANANDSDNNSNSNDNSNYQYYETLDCGLWMGESSIPNGGLGVYAGHALSRGQRIGSGEIMIPIVDNLFLGSTGSDGHNALDDITWSGPGLNALFGFEGLNQTEIVYPGMGALANSHLGLHNVDSEGFSHDSAGLSRRDLVTGGDDSTDANSNYNSSTMIGSFSYYHGLYSVAMNDIPKGHELFVNYGDDWFLGRREYLGDIPVATDYPIANRLIQTLAKALALSSDSDDGDDHDNKDHNNMSNNNTILQDVYQHIRNTAMDNPRIQFTLPKNLTELAQAAAVKGGIQYHHLPNVIRNEDWLRRNTYCVDHIAVNQQQSSSTAAAGRGAFATRDLPRFTIVAPLPVLPLNATYLNVTLPQHGNTKKHLLKGRQLLENYAFGNVNSKSDVHLFSYGFNTNFVNHAPTNSSSSDSDDGEELTPPTFTSTATANTLTANIKLQWSTRPYHKHAYTLLKPTMVTRKSFGMMLELVATRDIQQGEEILLDYGPAWERAYQEHVEETWNNVKNQTNTHNAKYVASFELNAQGQQEGQAHWDIRTLDEEKAAAAASESKHTYYSPNVGMACYANPVTAPMEEEEGANAYAWEQNYYSNNTHGKLVQYLDDDWDANQAGCFMPCLILERTTMPIHTTQEGHDHDADGSTSQTLYTVELLPTHQWDHECVMPGRVPRHQFRSPDNLGGKDPRPPFAIKVSQVPRSAIRFVDHPHTQDHYLNFKNSSNNESPNRSNSNVDVDVDLNLKAFRHPIGVPDDVWPAAWNN